MSSRRKIPRRRPGRPLLGAEPLDARLTVLVTSSMLTRIQERSGGDVSRFVRAALSRALGGGGKKVSRARRVARGARKVHRHAG